MGFFNRLGHAMLKGGRAVGSGLKKVGGMVGHGVKTLVKNPELIAKGGGALLSGIGAGLGFASGQPELGVLAGLQASEGAVGFVKDFKKAYKKTKKSDKVMPSDLVGAYREGKKLHKDYLAKQPRSGGAVEPSIEDG